MTTSYAESPTEQPKKNGLAMKRNMMSPQLKKKNSLNKKPLFSYGIH